MTKKCILLLSLLLSLHLQAQMRWNSVYQSYIDQYKNLAIEEMLRYNIPASITLAQGLFESGAGRSELSIKGNNHFGIKCHNWTGPTVYHNDDAANECFRSYDNALQSYEDHSRFLKQNSRYSSLFQLDRTDYKGWARGLKAAGYATNPRYADKLIELIELYKLYTLDQATSYDKFMAKRGGTDKPASNGMLLHPIHLYNKNYYIIARLGDTFKSIGEEIHISYRKIAKYNERNKDDVITPGEVIYLKKKQKHAEKRYKGIYHTIQPGESMYAIAQHYGIRLKSLYKLNNLSPDYQIQAGTLLRLY